MSTTTTTRTMPARFTSTCGACGAPIPKGSPILYRPGYLANHATCGEPTCPSAPRGAGRGRRGFTSYRCTHEDYPCCGCDS